MRIAAISVTNNDDHAMEKWLSYYQGYKREVYLHIIVDNSSRDEFKEKLRTKFPHAVVIERETNGGTTAAYNDGIKYALGDPAVDSIALIAQDIEFEEGALTALHTLLFSEKDVGMVGPVLFQANSKRIEQFGTNVRKNLMIERRMHGATLDDLTQKVVDVDMVPGGANLARREVYESVGLQDETLFMYGDEVDYHIRIRRAGYRLLVASQAKAWHQHQNVFARKYGSDLSFYYNNRNILLLNYRYASLGMALRTFMYLFFWRGPRYLVGFLREGEFRKSYIYFFGLVAGLFRYTRNWL